MPCLGCKDRDGEVCGCISACLGGRRRPQRPQALSTRRAPREVQMTATSTARSPAGPVLEAGIHRVSAASAVPERLTGLSLTMPRTGGREFEVCIDALIMIGLKSGQDVATSIDSFIDELVKNYNRATPVQHPRLRRSFIHESIEPRNEWTFRRTDWTQSNPPTLHEPRRILLLSPYFNPVSAWKKDVQVLWTYLKTHYKIPDNHECDIVTGVHLKPSYTVGDIKRFAQAIIYFYPALYTFQPDLVKTDARGGRFWDDEPDPAVAQKSRSQVIDSISAIETFDPAVAIHWPLADFLSYADATYCHWLFDWLIIDKLLSWRAYDRMITSIDEALWWADFRVSFIQACLAFTSLAYLQKIPRTHEGLREFMSAQSPPPGTTLRGKYRPRGARVA
ncbi:hypothetical protein GJ744_003036 [Endocarpon pusillum]|uniref:Uncharacterized protein n=1 Tax=Endocarpon pusillum TaxID=364733 RepID=A0A8H7AB76_9EURO|nr:hypothetical protein GJ744_003036 [Endocarpon pusillum]